jgi:hypothetical protein
MKTPLLAVLALIALPGIANAEYVKGPAVSAAAKAEAYCNMVASGAQRGYFAMGSSSYVAGAALGNAIGNMIAISEAKRNCMTMQGYTWVKPKRTATREANKSNKSRSGLANE